MTRLQFARKARSHFFLFSLMFWFVWIFYVLWVTIDQFVNKPIDRWADDFTADHWDNSLFLVLCQLLGSGLILVVVFHYILWFTGFREQNILLYMFQWFAVITGPIQFLGAFHIIRHASYHFYHQVDGWFD